MWNSRHLLFLLLLLTSNGVAYVCMMTVTSLCFRGGVIVPRCVHSDLLLSNAYSTSLIMEHRASVYSIPPCSRTLNTTHRVLTALVFSMSLGSSIHFSLIPCRPSSPGCGVFACVCFSCCYVFPCSQFAGPGAEKITVRARAISSKLQELFGLPPNWKPKGHAVRGKRDFHMYESRLLYSRFDFLRFFLKA